ncbi:SH3 domain-containing protein [Paenibacillus sp. CC-CFT747]|nr:SH3 domain-containing protein [Paenibacillus sp. CC-CFT747]
MGKTPASSKGKTRALRAEPTVKSVIYADLPPEEEVMIWGEENGWYHVQQKDGYTGYVRKSELILSRIETIPNPVKEKEHLPGSRPGAGLT